MSRGLSVISIFWNIARHTRQRHVSMTKHEPGVEPCKTLASIGKISMLQPEIGLTVSGCPYQARSRTSEYQEKQL
jgi:hypothetical protein